MLNFMPESTQLSQRDRNKAEKLERIVAAGRELFGAHGFEATTTRAIAEHARIGVGTLFVYFPEKADLLFHIFRTDLERVSAEALSSAPVDTSANAALMHVFGELFRFYDTDRKLARVFVREFLFSRGAQSDDLQATSVRFMNQLGELVTQRTLQRGHELQVEGFQAGCIVFGLYYFTLVNWLSGAIKQRELALTQLERSLTPTLAGLVQPSTPEDVSP